MIQILDIFELFLRILSGLLIKCTQRQIIIFNLSIYLGMEKNGTQEGMNKLCFMNDKLKSLFIRLCESLRGEE